MSADSIEVVDRTRSLGWARMSGSGDALQEVIDGLGTVLHVEDVRPRPDSRALLNSRRSLSPHTDHHRADFIVWDCIAQCERGGQTQLIDGIAVFEALPRQHREALQEVSLVEHSVFDGDMDRHPMITWDQGRPRLYYSFWLADDGLTGARRDAFMAFTRALEVAPMVQLRLSPGDVLAVDNGRMLHARTAILGDRPRHLRRYWIEDRELAV